MCAHLPPHCPHTAHKNHNPTQDSTHNPNQHDAGTRRSERSERSRYRGWVTIPGTTTRLCTRQGLIVPQPMHVGSVLSCVLGPLPPCGLTGSIVPHPQPRQLCAHTSLPMATDMRTPPHPTPRPTPPCTESPSERPCRQAQTHQQTRQRRAPQQRQQRETPSGWVLLGGNFGVWYPYRKPLLHV